MRWRSSTSSRRASERRCAGRRAAGQDARGYRGMTGPIAPGDKSAVPCPHRPSRVQVSSLAGEARVERARTSPDSRALDDFEGSSARASATATPVVASASTSSPNSSPSTTTRCTISSPTTTPSRRGLGSSQGDEETRCRARRRTRGPARHPLERGGTGRVPHLRRGGSNFGTSRATASSCATGATSRCT